MNTQNHSIYTNNAERNVYVNYLVCVDSVRMIKLRFIRATRTICNMLLSDNLVVYRTCE